MNNGNPFVYADRKFRLQPQYLGGDPTLATNDTLVAASYGDPWIRAVDAGLTSHLVAAITRTGAVVNIDMILCSSNGSPLGGGIVEVIIKKDTTNDATAVTHGALLLDESISTALLAAGAAVLQDGRRTLLQADATTGRVTAAITLNAAADCVVIVRYPSTVTKATAIVTP